MSTKCEMFQRGREIGHPFFEMTSKGKMGESVREEMFNFLIKKASKSEVGEGRGECLQRFHEMISEGKMCDSRR